jgi:hypothetical protein
VRKPRVVAPKLNQEQKDEINGQMLNVTDIEALDKKAFAEAKGFNPQSIPGIISNMVNFPNIYNDLRKKGFTDPQIPKWVARSSPSPSPTPVPSLGPVPSLAATPLSAGTLPIVQLGQENEVERVSGVRGGE